MAELEDKIADRLLDEHIQREKERQFDELIEKVSCYELVISRFQEMLLSDNEELFDYFEVFIDVVSNYQRAKIYSKLSAEELYKIMKDE